MGLKILVIDDSMFMRMILKNLLTSYGYTDVLEAENGKDGIEMFEINKLDLVLLDIIMHGIDGVETLRRIMEIDMKAKVVMITAVGQEETMKKCRELGSIGYITKPFEEKEIADMLDSIIGSSEN